MQNNGIYCYSMDCHILALVLNLALLQDALLHLSPQTNKYKYKLLLTREWVWHVKIVRMIFFFVKPKPNRYSF